MPRVSDIAANEKPVIIFHEVTKAFNIKHTHSFKEAFIAALKRKELSSTFNAVNGVSFEVKKGESVALMGRNGSGKSTTLKLLSGVMQPDSGWIRTRGRLAGLLEVGAGFHPDLTGRENVYLNAAILGMSKEETEDRFASILEFSEIGEFIDTEVKRYSSGMYARLGFSVAVHTEPDTLLVDEVLSVGDAQFREKCNNKMMELQQSGLTMFIVSHSFAQVKQLCSRGIVLNQGRVAFDGGIDDAVDFMEAAGPLSDPLNFPVEDEIRKVFLRVPERYGQPLSASTEISQNGSGVVQLFENGYITFSHALKRGHGLLRGEMLDAYLETGGAAGPWGFLAEKADGANDGRVKSLSFQNGQVRLNGADGFTITQ